MTPITIKECQGILLEISKKFHDLCINNKIPYYMLGGTMLGAIRHKGFIPWDDDIDFGVPREFYDKLVEICEQKFEHPYKVITYKNANYPLTFLKIEDTRTYIDDPWRTEHKEIQLGINIDIFPMDTCSVNTKNLKRILKKKRLYTRLIVALYFNSKHNTPLKKIARFILKLFLNQDINYWMKKDYDLIKKANETGCDARINLSGIHEEIHSNEVLGKPTLYKFEDTFFYGVYDYDSYLKQLYNNYNQLPPQKDRHTHANGYYIK